MPKQEGPPERPGYPWSSTHDYRGFEIIDELDAPLVGTGAAKRALRLESTQAIRDFINAGTLPARFGSQPKNPRAVIPLWAIEGLVAHRDQATRRTSTPPCPGIATAASFRPKQTPPADVDLQWNVTQTIESDDVHAIRDVARRATSAGEGGALARALDDEELRARIQFLETENSRLRDANSNLVFAWSAARRARTRADAARHFAGTVARELEAAAKQHGRLQRDLDELGGRLSALTEVQREASAAIDALEESYEDALTMFVIPPNAGDARTP